MKEQIQIAHNGKKEQREIAADIKAAKRVTCHGSKCCITALYSNEELVNRLGYM
jgi:hypothetical protein